MESSFGLTFLYLLGIAIWFAFLFVVGVIVWKTPRPEGGGQEASNVEASSDADSSPGN